MAMEKTEDGRNHRGDAAVQGLTSAGSCCKGKTTALEVLPQEGGRRNTPSSLFLPPAPPIDYTQRGASWYGSWEMQAQPTPCRAKQGKDMEGASSRTSTPGTGTFAFVYLVPT